MPETVRSGDDAPLARMRHRFAAIDCGTTRNAIGAFASTSDGALVLVDFALFPLEPGTGGDPAWLRQFDAMFAGPGPRRRPVTATLLAPPPQLTLTKLIRVPVGATLAELRAEAARNIPYPLDEVAWDVEPLQEAGAGGDFALAALKLEIAEGLCAVARRHRRAVTRIVPAGLALAWACRHNYPEIEGTGLVIDVGPRSGTLVFVAAGRRLLVRTVGLAPSRMPERVAVGVEAGGVSADGRGPDDGGAEPAEEAMAALAMRLALEINRSMAVLRSAGDEKLDVILLTGEAAASDELVAQLAARTGRPVERFDPLRRVQVAPGAAGAAGAAGVAPQLAVVVGLAAAAVAERPAINLLPPRLQRAASRRLRYPFWLAAGAFAVASLFPPAFGCWRAERVCRERAAWLEARIAPLRQLDQRNQAAAQEIAAARAEILRLHRLWAARTNWCGLLDDLQGRLRQVDDAWLDRLELMPPADPTGGRREATLFTRQPVSPDHGDGGPVRLRIAGRLLERQHPAGRVGAAARDRAASLVRTLASAAFVAAIEDERFDDSQPGLLRFECTLVLDRQKPL